MDRNPPRAPVAALLALALAAGPVLPVLGEVTLYRCTDAGGTVTVQDTPCAAGTRQEVRTMQRPQDPPPANRAPPPAQPPPPAAPARSVQTIVLRAPQPMYECVTPDGGRYTSDTGDGNPRFVPLWTRGVPYHGYGHGPVAPPARDRPVASPPRGGLSTAPVNNISIPSTRNVPQPPPPPPRRPPPGHGHDRGHRGYGYGGGGTWIRDTCTALPAVEVCSRLRDRRDSIRRRTFNAQESERRTLRTEERTLNARLAEDCGL